MENTKTVIFTGEFEGNKTETTIIIKVLEGDSERAFENILNAIVMGGFCLSEKNSKIK